MCFLRSRCSMEMWCPDDTGRDSFGWLLPPTGVRPRLDLLLLLFWKRLTTSHENVYTTPRVNWHATPWQNAWESRLPASPPPPRRSTPEPGGARKKRQNRRTPFIAAPTAICSSTQQAAQFTLCVTPLCCTTGRSHTPAMN